MKRRIAIVTGVTGDIGLAVANALIAGGLHVIGIARNEPTCDFIKSISDEVKFHFYKLDVSDINEIENFFSSSLVKNSYIDCLVTCAGILEMINIYTLDNFNWDKTININLNGTFNFFKFTIKKAIIDGNSANLYAIGSRWGQDGNKSSVAYSASKSALRAFIKSLQFDLLNSNIRAFLISPGSVSGKMSKSVDKNYKEKLIEPNQIANLILFINSSDENILFDEITIKAKPYDFL